ncbi:hypothetical protein KKF61_07505 [Patescibacteria group bacterium]|nr:hypothetical protein [Patescibacteria group bacterium]
MQPIQLKSIGDLVREMEQDDKMGNTKTSKYVTYYQRKNLDQIDAYINSRHISGSTDALGREKPFFNIVTAIRNIWYRATDIDRKNINLTATKKADYVLSMVANILIKKWMRKIRFGKFLNEWGRVQATYGGAVSRFLEKDGQLIPEVIPWNRIICDPIDFDNNIKIIKLWLTPAQLTENPNYDKDMVSQLLNAQESRETTDGEKKDSKGNYIEVLEVYGRLPLYHITENEDDQDKYEDMFCVMSYVVDNTKGKADYTDYYLVNPIRKKKCLRLDNLIDEDGRAIGVGAVESGFEEQWMKNHTVKAIKDQLDIASKLITQTSDGSFVGQNVLSMIENGDILIHKPNQPLTRINNQPDIAALQSFGNEWLVNYNQKASASEAMKGETPKSGTAWRQTEAILIESHSLFEQMVENKGLSLEEMFTDFIIPFIKKKMDTSEEISEILESHQIRKLDTMFLPAEVSRRVNRKVIDNVLSKTKEDVERGDLMTPEQQMNMAGQERMGIENALQQMGNQRFIKPSEIKTKTWKDALRDFEWNIDIDVTGESEDKQAILSTLNTVLQVIGSKPDILEDERARAIFGKILENVKAMSVSEIAALESPSPAMAAPAQQATNLEVK